MPSLRPSDWEALKQLEADCTDWTIHNRDYWRPHFGLKIDIRYEVHCARFFERGSGVGRTLEEAITRALAMMRRRIATLPRISDEDLESLGL